jgi:mannose-1-phosphate guanylyltransferase
VKAIVLCAGLGTRLRPVTDARPKALARFLNVPLLERRLDALRRLSVTEVAVNLHHEGRQIVEYLDEAGPERPAVRFFWEPEILGTAGALRNARGFLEGDDFLVWNVDAEIEIDLAALAGSHRESGALSTLLVVANPRPEVDTPVAVRAGRVTAFGGRPSDPRLFTGVSIHSPEVLERIPEGRRGLVEALWRPALAERPDALAAVVSEEPFFDLGTPGGLLDASLRALESRDDFAPKEGFFDRDRRVLSREPGAEGGAVLRSVLGGARVERGARVRDCVLWDGADVAAGAELDRCLVGAVRVEAGAPRRDRLLWPRAGGGIREIPLHGDQRASPARK